MSVASRYIPDGPGRYEILPECLSGPSVSILSLGAWVEVGLGIGLELGVGLGLVAVSGVSVELALGLG